jgi:hypothetical protein
MTRRNCPGITRGHIDLRQQGFRATERDDVDERCRECRESIPEHVSSRCVAERHMPTKERRSGAFMNISLMVPAQLRQDIGRHADHEIDVTGHQILRRRGATTVRYESKCRMHRRIPNEQCCFLCNAGMRWVLGALRSRPRVAWQSARRGLRRRDQVGLFLGMSSGRPLGRIGHDLEIFNSFRQDLDLGSLRLSTGAMQEFVAAAIKGLKRRIGHRAGLAWEQAHSLWRTSSDTSY